MISASKPLSTDVLELARHTWRDNFTQRGKTRLEILKVAATYQMDLIKAPCIICSLTSTLLGLQMARDVVDR